MLARVVSTTENERLLHDEREAVLSQRALRDAPSGVKIAMTIVAIALVVGAIVGVDLLIAFH